ncbi:hypothetical protein [Rhodococcus koreensis]|uniref:Uncharacterized protein n=1 Tax=Rhodococcus koreensis TaxID=99653 RepID=A0A1H4I5T7_9NOCA|nr:hypothetical protein [Rhodococcus koreensis]SEB29459.1 hypothetical protein SAMN04490239_0094 [Rhodococcus koreensis]
MDNEFRNRSQLHEDLITTLETAHQHRDRAAGYWPTVVVIPTAILAIGSALIALTNFVAPGGSLIRWIMWLGVVGSAAAVLLIQSAPYLRAAAADSRARKMLKRLIARDEEEQRRAGGHGAPA